jgi:hypothetical protein
MISQIESWNPLLHKYLQPWASSMGASDDTGIPFLCMLILFGIFE